MKYAPLLLLALAACPSDDDPTNGQVLYIAPDGAETRLKLVEARPAPF